ncbi:MAG: hypothetical protein L0Y39_05145, partial [Methylococcaceae bacterium]|nr:hypothetical protein [Methylococcaceae bacterium]
MKLFELARAVSFSVLSAGLTASVWANPTNNNTVTPGGEGGAVTQAVAQSASVDATNTGEGNAAASENSTSTVDNTDNSDNSYSSASDYA